VIETNLTGMFLVTRAILPLNAAWRDSGEQSVDRGETGVSGWSAYAASKHGALGLTNTLREELRPRGIRVIALLPGATDTTFGGFLGGGSAGEDDVGGDGGAGGGGRNLVAGE